MRPLAPEEQMNGAEVGVSYPWPLGGSRGNRIKRFYE